MNTSVEYEIQEVPQKIATFNCVCYVQIEIENINEQ